MNGRPPIPALRAAHAALGSPERPAYLHVGHPGLRLRHFLPAQADPAARAAFLASFAAPCAALDGYAAAFARWQATLHERGARVLPWPALGRLAFGLGDRTVLQSGLRLHATYGVPLIAGAALKGLAARYAARVFALDPRSDAHAAVFGRGGPDAHAGAVAFHDALWVPEAASPFAVDALAPHHPDYAAGAPGEWPADWDRPVAIVRLSARGTFLFALEGQPAVVAFAERVLATALADWGIGGRTSRGYGRFATGATPPAAPALPLAEVAAAPATPSAAAPAEETAGAAAWQTAEADLVALTEGANEIALRIAGVAGPLEATVKIGLPGLFDDAATASEVRLKLKKGRTVRATVRYRSTGPLIEVTHVAPALPGR